MSSCYYKMSNSAARLIKLYKLFQFTFCCLVSKCYCMVPYGVSNYMFFKYIMHFHTSPCSCNVLYLDGFLLHHRKYTLILLGLAQGHSSLLLSNSLSPEDSNPLDGRKHLLHLSISCIFHSVCHMVSAQ